MTTVSLSSTPLTTLLPNSSPQKNPNYNNAFSVNLPSLSQITPLFQNTSPLNSNNFANKVVQDFTNKMNPSMYLTQLKGGLTLSKSNNIVTALQGQNMVQGAQNKLSDLSSASSSIFPTDGTGKLSFNEKFSNSTFGKNYGAWSAGLNTANTLFTGLFGEKSEYDGEKGDVTRSIDSVYDTVQNFTGTIPGVGQAISLGMGANKLLGNVVNKLGGGTDGMCVCAGTKVFKANGEIINIEDLKQEDGIIGWSESTKQIVPQTIHNIIEPRQKECLEITTKSGFTLRCSIDHPILSDNSPKAKSHRINGQRIAYRDWKFRRADELKVGDFIGVANNIDYWGSITLDKAYLIGLLIGDGTYTKGSSCRLISADKFTWDYIESNNLGVINHCDDSRPDKYNTEIRTYRIIDGMDLMRQVGLVYQSGQNKTLPKNIGQFTKDSVCQLLAGLYDTDGSISVNEDKNNWSITLYQSNKNLLQEVKQQLHKLGIFASISTRKASQYQLGGRIINSNQSYRLEVGDITSAIKFTQLIPLNIDYKKANLNRIYNLLKDKKAQEHPKLSGAKQFKIIDIKPIGLQTVYNLQADTDHTYLANGIITHNTTTDAILGSSFLSLTPFGLINGFGGKRADTITKNDEVFEQVGSSYTGSESNVNNALTKSGKKYGLFSSDDREEANRQIAEAKRQQSIIENIADEATDMFAASNSMAAINGNRRKYYLQGGYNQANVRVGKSGMSLDLMAKAKKVLHESRKLKEGGQITPTKILLVVPEFQDGGQINKKDNSIIYARQRFPILKSIEVNLQYDPNFRPREIGNFGDIEYMTSEHDDLPYYRNYKKEDQFKGKPTIVYNDNVDDEDIALDMLSHGLREQDENWKSYFLPNLENDWKQYIIDELFTSTLPISLDKFKNLSDKDKQRYFRQFDDNFKLGKYNEQYNSILDGLVRALSVKDEFRQSKGYNYPQDILNNLRNTNAWKQAYDYINSNLLPEIIVKHQEGGSINIIPEGALHARRHNMDMEGITPKGIPVVSNKEGGEVEQQAEIEREEIIFRLEVTKKLEELEKKYYDDETSQKEKDECALEAGKLLVEEILYNTQDNTNSLL